MTTSPSTEFASPQSRIRGHLTRMSEASLAGFAKGVEGLIAINPESFAQVVDQLPALNEDLAQDKVARAELKELFPSVAEALGAGVQGELVKVAQQVLAEKAQGAPTDLGQFLDDKLAEMSKQTLEQNELLKKALEETLEKANTPDPRLAKNDDELPFALPNESQGGGGSADSGGGAGADPGGDSGSGGGSGGGGDYGGPDVPRLPTPENRLADLGNLFRSPVAESSKSPDSNESKSNPWTGPKKKSPADVEPASQSKGPGDLSDGAIGPQTPAQSAMVPAAKSALPAMGPAAAWTGGAPDSAAGGAGLAGGNMMGMPFGGGMMGAGMGGLTAQGNTDTSFPFSLSASTQGAEMASPQKFDYKRSVGYGSSSSGGGAAGVEPMAAGLTNDPPTVKGRLSSLQGVGRGLATGEPAFIRAISKALGELCSTGDLDCSREGQGGRR